MAAHLMKRSGTTLIRDGGKPLVGKARMRKLVREAGSRDVEGRMISGGDYRVLERRTGSLENASGGRSLFPLRLMTWEISGSLI